MSGYPDVGNVSFQVHTLLFESDDLIAYQEQVLDMELESTLQLIAYVSRDRQWCEASIELNIYNVGGPDVAPHAEIKCFRELDPKCEAGVLLFPVLEFLADFRSFFAPSANTIFHARSELDVFRITRDDPDLLVVSHCEGKHDRASGSAVLQCRGTEYEVEMQGSYLSIVKRPV